MATVLIGEDETLIRLDIRTSLEDSGYDVGGEARDGLEAVELARTLEPDVVILDVKMPQLDGIEAARQILAERPVPILLLTAYSNEKLVERAGEVGVFAYLVKPFRANELKPAIQTAIARHQEMLELRDEADTLADALAARKSIERAKGLLMKHEGLGEAEAFARLRTASQKSRQPLKAIADAIVAALD
ncbi:MAG TPA: response regulator [Gaiellaceae bacterium]|jgi:AmiR/NasT family two-component response regulator|nr:response regulator [Gaiellaceae bacterium]